MRRRHFHELHPVCPACRDPQNTHLPSPLEVHSVSKQDRDWIEEGLLACTNPTCRHEFPIIDGIPVLIANLRAYVRDNVAHLMANDGLSADLQSLIGDCCGPEHWWNTLRQQISSYVWDHYADFDPAEAKNSPFSRPQPSLAAPQSPDSSFQAPFSPLFTPKPGAVARLFDQAWPLLPQNPSGAVLDLGCGPGRLSFEVAARSNQLVLGIDAHFPLLKIAISALRGQHVRYGRRRVGLVYDQRDIPLRFGRSENVDFWACDATNLPFSPGTFSAAVGMNVLDSVQSPVQLLRSLSDTLTDQGHAILACPYDWSAQATTIEGWIGGHSQRGSHQGASEPLLRMLLSHQSPQATMPGKQWRIIADQEHVPWHVRLHERSFVQYDTHLVIASSGPA